MLRLLESKDEIAKAQEALERTLRRALARIAIKDIGHPGGRERGARVSTDGQYWFWSKHSRRRTVANPRRLNWFGRYNERRGLGITVEVNTAYEGRNDRVAGFFARDTETGNDYLVHSGRVGGGTKGVGKDAFCVWSGEALIAVAGSVGPARLGILVMPVAGPSAFRSIARYIDLVARFKLAVRAGETKTSAFRRKQREFEEYYSEGWGR